MEKSLAVSDWEHKCYGLTEAELDARYSQYIKLAGTEMFVAGLLSDCQEMLEHDHDKDEIRKTLNVAKFFLFKNMERKAA